MTTTEPKKLPRGRHGLAPGVVRRSQQERLTTALVSEVAARGYEATTVAHIVATARVSRESFYVHYADKAACYGAAREATVAGLVAGAQPDMRGDLEPIDRVQIALSSYMLALAASPLSATCFLLERPDRGGRMTVEETQVALLGVESLMELFPKSDRFACTAVSAMVREIVAEHVDGGRTADLPGVVAPLLALIRRMLE